MKLLDTLEELYKEIESDKKTNIPSAIRYPIRFVFLNSFESLRNFISCLETKAVNYIELTTCLPKDDGWLTSDNVVTIVKNLKQDSTIVPLSEVLRFFNKEDYFITINALAEIETKDNLRIYIPFVGQLERFRLDFWENFHRKEHWAPVWIVENDMPSKVTIYQMFFHINDFKEGRIIPDSKTWLETWKILDTFKFISYSKALGNLTKNFAPDSIVDLKKITNHKEFLEVFYNSIIPIDYKDTEMKYWEILTGKIISWNGHSMNLESIILNELNLRTLDNITVEDFFKFYIERKNDFERWLIKHFLLNYNKYKKSYLINVLNKMHSLDSKELVELIWFDIFDNSYEDKIFEERKKFLQVLHHELKESFDRIEDNLRIKLQGLNSLKTFEKIKFLTDISFSERKYIIELLQNSTNFSADVNSIKEIYPALYHYLNWDAQLFDFSIDEWIIDYLKNYNKSKILNRKEHTLDVLLNEKNKNKETFCEWYYKIDEVKEEISDEIWLDGLGAEWFPLLIYFIEEYGKMHNKIIGQKFIEKVNLPSITECNKHDKALKISDLDEYIHSENPYRFPDDLVREMEILENIVKKIIETNVYDVISIVSDHGFTFLSQKPYNNIKKMSFDAHHDGRCVWVDKNTHYNDDDYFVVWKTEKGNCCGKKSLVATKHTSLQDVPIREVHGGATPEEILVPYIILKSETVQIEYKIEPDSFEISLKSPNISFKISPEPEYTPKLKCDKISFDVDFNRENNKYYVNLHSLKTGKYELIVEIGNKKYSINVRIKGGFEESNLI